VPHHLETIVIVPAPPPDGTHSNKEVKKCECNNAFLYTFLLPLYHYVCHLVAVLELLKYNGF
jgi:hypothetical protein